MWWWVDASEPRGAPDVVPIVHKAIEVVAEADTGVGVPDHELIAEVHRVLSGGLGITRLHEGAVVALSNRNKMSFVMARLRNWRTSVHAGSRLLTTDV